MGHLVTLFQKNKIIVQDGFNRADNASSMGNANTGQAWTALAGTWGISANQAYMSAVGIANKNAIVVDAITANVSIEVLFATMVLGNTRIVWRMTDLDNGFIIQPAGTGYFVYRLQAGSYISIGTYTMTPADGDKIRIVCSGSTIKVFINGIERLSMTDTFNQTTTKHGLGSDSLSTGRFDNFKVEAL